MLSEEESRRALEATAATVRSCVRCRLHTTRTNAVPGEGDPHPRVLLVGEAPGRDEDASGRPFVGRAGRILDRALDEAGLTRKSVFVTNVVKCRPPGNRTPKADEIEVCRTYLMGQIACLRPAVIVTLGATATRGLLGNGVELKGVRGRTLTFSEIPVIPTYHPAAVLYNRNLERALVRDLRKAARRPEVRGAHVRSGPPRPGKPTRRTHSSGGVVHDPEGRVLLLKRADEEVWCLPKGTVEEGETLERTAVREIAEETGLEVRLQQPVRTVAYGYYWPPEDVNYDKRVSYFLAEPVAGNVKLEKGFDGFRWVDRSQALELLRWPNDRDVVSSALDLLEPPSLSGGRTADGRGATRSRRPRP